MQINQPLHFRTTNAPLAEALARVGFNLVAIRNVYTDALLEHHRMPNVIAAKAAGKPGIVTYYFEQRFDLVQAVKAWDDAGAALDKKEPFTVDIEARKAMPIIRAVMRGNQEFRDLWKTVDAQYVQSAEGETKEEKEELPDGRIQHTQTIPGFKIVSEKATEDERQQIFNR